MFAKPLAEEHYPLPPRSIVGWIYTKGGMEEEKLYILKMYAIGFFFVSLL